MPDRQTLHQLIDKLPEGEIDRARHVLTELLEAAATDPLARCLDAAPVDDELESQEERAAVSEAWEEHRRGESLTTEELRRDLGL